MACKYRVGRKLKIENDVFVIAAVDFQREMTYNLIDINTGERWFNSALDQYNFLLELKKLEKDCKFEFVN